MEREVGGEIGKKKKSKKQIPLPFKKPNGKIWRILETNKQVYLEGESKLRANE